MNFYWCLFPILISWTLLLGGCAKINAIDAADARSERNERAIEEIQKVIEKIGNENDGRTEFAIRNKKRLLREVGLKAVCRQICRAASILADCKNFEDQMDAYKERRSAIVMKADEARVLGPEEGWEPLVSIYSDRMAHAYELLPMLEVGTEEYHRREGAYWNPFFYNNYFPLDLEPLDPEYNNEYVDWKTEKAWQEAIAELYEAASYRVGKLHISYVGTLKTIFDSPHDIAGLSDWLSPDDLDTWWDNYPNSYPKTYSLYDEQEMIDCVHQAIYGVGDSEQINRNWIEDFEREFDGRFKF